VNSISLQLGLALILGFAACAAEAAPSETHAPLDKLQVMLAVTERPEWPKPPSDSVEVTLLPQAEAGAACVVSFGLPFGPGWLEDENAIHVTGADGVEIPAFTKPLAYWHLDGRRGTARSVLIQFAMDFAEAAPRKVTITWGQAPSVRRTDLTPIADTQITRHEEAPEARQGKADSFDYRSPKVLALLPPEWLCASLLVWQQVPAETNATAPWYDSNLLSQFPDSLLYISSNRRAFDAHLFDRTATYVKMYARFGEEEHLRAALKTGDFYIQHLGGDGFFEIKPQKDHKYTFTEGPALIYLLTGDERYRAAIDRAVAAWDTRTKLEYKADGFWTERHHAFGLMAYLHAYEITGDPRLLAAAARYFEVAWKMQVAPVDGREPDGAWVHRASDHGDGSEGDWITSPWMSAFLADAIWKYWMISGDARGPASLALYAKFTQRHSVTPDGAVYYIAASPARGTSDKPQPGTHNMEAIYLLAMGYYLSGGGDASFLPNIAALRDAMLQHDPEARGRKFTWRFRETSMLIWFLAHIPPQTQGAKGAK
jgi:hypothetical protein